ncbi:unnamed protein product [Blumeria hordei]|uniref:Mitochondrial outer membrane translocase complex, subunit Tom5 n=2 Tax=Blumeria hordei TaxID=2867405 RepID=A0A383UR76_BLUHO|nr:Tom5 family protein [Blumeria hordei DH14]SZF01762.1 unnamed protein product [Blumeria hordei]
MFGLFGEPPPTLSAAEIKKQEKEACSTIQSVLIGSALLYLSPFAVDAMIKLL